MKATQKDFPSVAQRAAKSCSVFFFCGPDEAGASAGAQRIVELLDDPGERLEISGSTLKRDPVLLGDEARSGSLFGDKRHIYVRAVGDEAFDAIGNHLLAHGEGCPVIVVATSATDKSRTAKLLEKRDDALVAMFWPPDLRTVTGSVRAMGDAAGVRLAGDLAERIARGAGLDVRLAASEVEKLALYLDASPQAPKAAQSSDLDEIGAATEEDGLMPLVNAVMSGDTNRLSSEIGRFRALSLNPVGLLLAIERRAAQLARITAKLGSRGSLDTISKGEKAQLGIFFLEEREIRNQLTMWRSAKLERLVPRLVELHRSLLNNSQAAETLLSNDLAEICRFAARR